MDKKRLIFLLAGPSGAGKNTILTNALDKIADIEQMPTATTRSRRSNEIEGREHFFYSENEFDQLIKDSGLIEWQVGHGKRYGTLKKIFERSMSSKKDYIADIEVLGALQLKEVYPNNVIIIFVNPPSIKVLEERIRQRGNMTDEEIASRINRAQLEVALMPKCDYIINNNNIDQAIEHLKNIILDERNHRSIKG